MATLRELVIIGAGGFGREVLAWARQSHACGQEWKIKGFLDDRELSALGVRLHAPLLGRIVDYQPQPEDLFICAVGTPAVRRHCSETILARHGEFTRLIHPTAVLGDEVSLGEGVILCPHTVVSGYNTLGRGVVVNLHSSVDHDATVGDWTQINCHCDLTGGVRVGNEVWFGSHVAVAPGVAIGDGAYLGIGSVVLRDIPAGAKVFGVPARRLE